MKETYKRGQIYFIESDPHQPPVGDEIWSDRLALIVSNDTGNFTSGIIEIVYLTTSFRKRPSPLHIKVTSNNKTVLALCEQIHTVDKSRIRNYVGSITNNEQKEIDAALLLNLNLFKTSHPIGIFKKWENYINKYHLSVVDEQKELRKKLNNSKEEKLLEQINILIKERDCFKALYESKEAILNEIQNIAN